MIPQRVTTFLAVLLLLVALTTASINSPSRRCCGPCKNDAKADHFKPSFGVEEFLRKFFDFYLTKPSGLDEVLKLVSVTDLDH